MADRSVTDSILKWGRAEPDAVAIDAVDGPSITYRSLAGLITRGQHQLRAAGVRRTDVVGIVAPNGPFAASSFLTVASTAVAAPLNPSYTDHELDFYMRDLDMKAVLVPDGASEAAENVAAARGILVLRPMLENPTTFGEFDLQGLDEDGGGGSFEPPRPDDVALVLHTSGTTSRPKMVPLLHANLAASVDNISTTLELTPRDRCLNIMPLFHIHGLAAALMSSIHSGASIVCTPGFDATAFLGWVNEYRPTWYTAVPTMHQAIAARLEANRPQTSSLRFGRSSSSSLAPTTMAALESGLGVPIIEAYGMTEASHQMASNPLPPAIRKPGSVGLPTGQRIGIMDDSGTFVDAGVEGEIVIQGRNVTAGYAANPEANAEAFSDGWFRTGDLGRLDDDGYLFISGRKKEIINRGGETISPREIDEALLDHPSVAQALAFPVPDRRLGEQIAATVVVGSSADAPPSERALREFASLRLTPTKVPRRILFVDEIPKGPTGKPQRIGLADRLGLTDLDDSCPSSPHTAPDSMIERLVADEWSKVLDVDSNSISIHDHFLDLGGDSLLVTRLLAAIEAATGVQLTMLDVSDRPTISAQARLIETRLLGGEGDA